MPDTRWRRAEREIAALFDTTRLAKTGGGQPHFRTDKYAVQIKTRMALPERLTEAVDQAIRDCRPGELPVVLLNQVSRGKKARRLLVVDVESWIRTNAEGGS